jgi:hypothetical protein
MILGWILKTALGRIVGGTLTLILVGTFLYFTHQVRGCIRNEETIRQYQRADEIRKEDKQNDEQTEKEKNRIDTAPEWNLGDELKRLRQHAAEADHR